MAALPRGAERLGQHGPAILASLTGQNRCHISFSRSFRGRPRGLGASRKARAVASAHAACTLGAIGPAAKDAAPILRRLTLAGEPPYTLVADEAEKALWKIGGSDEKEP